MRLGVLCQTGLDHGECGGLTVRIGHARPLLHEHFSPVSPVQKHQRVMGQKIQHVGADVYLVLEGRISVQVLGPTIRPTSRMASASAWTR